MGVALFIIFVVVPLVELAVIIQVAGEIGVLTTIAILVADSLLGAYLAKREGLAVWRRLRDTIRAGQMPSQELLEGALVLIGATLLLTPGFVTDAVGLALLLPLLRGPITKLIRRATRRFVLGKVEARVSTWEAGESPPGQARWVRAERIEPPDEGEDQGKG